MIACAAMASASNANASPFHTVMTIWWAASTVSPYLAATTVVAMMTPRSASVRTSSGTPPRAATRIPAVCGDNGAPSWIALRTTVTTRATAMPVWARTVPMADPAMPRPAP